MGTLTIRGRSQDITRAHGMNTSRITSHPRILFTHLCIVMATENVGFRTKHANQHWGNWCV